MVTDYVEGKVMVAFKPEADHSDIEKVLSQYIVKKVFNNGEYSGSNEREGKVLDRFYSLTVPAGKEADVVDELKEKYGALVEFTHQPLTRRAIER